MFPLPESPRKVRYLRMAIAFFVCLTCAVLGWPFVATALAAVAQLSQPLASLPLRTVARAFLPAVPGFFLWSVAVAFFLFTLIKVEVKNKEKHLTKFILVQNVGRAFLWLTVPIAILWVVGNSIVGGPQ